MTLRQLFEELGPSWAQLIDKLAESEALKEVLQPEHAKLLFESNYRHFVHNYRVAPVHMPVLNIVDIEFQTIHFEDKSLLVSIEPSRNHKFHGLQLRFNDPDKVNCKYPSYFGQKAMLELETLVQGAQKGLHLRIGQQGSVFAGTTLDKLEGYLRHEVLYKAINQSWYIKDHILVPSQRQIYGFFTRTSSDGSISSKGWHVNEYTPYYRLPKNPMNG